MPDRDFFLLLEPFGNERIRVEYVRHRRTVLTFITQYESVIDGEHVPVIRYDSAHDQPHRDTLGIRGTSVSKQWLADMDNNEAMTFAIDDLRKNWRAFRRRFVGDEE